MKTNDNVFRALNPRRAFERSDGTISPAAFKDRKGLSVEIGLERTDFEVINAMHSYLDGNILKINALVCGENNIEVYDDNSPNKYHRLLINADRNDDNDFCLTEEQCFALAIAESNELIRMDFAYNG